LKIAVIRFDNVTDYNDRIYSYPKLSSRSVAFMSAKSFPKIAGRIQSSVDNSAEATGQL